MSMADHNMKNLPIHKSGFALLMALLVVSVVVSVGLTLVDITLKQLRLATGAKDSEAAFHAAAAGVECLRYHRNQENATPPHPYENYENGINVNTTCFGQVQNNISATQIRPPDRIYKYEFEYSWSGRCTKATMITMNPDFSNQLALTNAEIITHIPGYHQGGKDCEPGGRCTILAVQGYNRTCSNANQIGTVQREILLEL